MDKEITQKIAEKHNLDLIVLFGSQASGKTHKHSDVDIAVKAKKILDLNEIISIQNDFCQLLGRPDVEIVDIQIASPILLKEITDNGKVLFSKNEDIFAILRMYAFKLFIETKPLRDYRHKYLENYIKNYA